MEHDTTTSSTVELSFSTIFGPTLSQEETLEWIKMDAATYKHFLSFPSSEQERIISFIAGQKGLKISYDPFFQRILSPILHPERLESFLSELLDERVHIEKILPREGLRMAEEASIIIMDILVQLSNGSRVNVEMQKLGIYFPGERSSCYAADAIMRQYTELKNSLKDDFSYKKMKPFYIDNKLQAWLTFFSSDEPADIIALITAYPEFRELYEEIAEFRTNPKELINMYSEALAVADRNTIRLMIDDMQDELASLTQQVADKSSEITAKENELAEKNSEIAEKNSEIAHLKAELERLKSMNP